MTLFVDNPSVEKALTMTECMDALEQAYIELGNGRATIGEIYRILTPQPATAIPGATDPVHHVYTSLSGAIAKWNLVANRVDSDFIHYPIIDGRRRQVRLPGSNGLFFCGFVQLYSSLSGEPLAVVHDGYLQKFRTGGTSGLGTRHLAKKNARVLGIIGSGWQAAGAIQAHCLACKFDLVKIYSPTKRNRESFASEWAARLDAKVVPVETCEEAVRGADVVSTTTNALDPVLKTEWLEPGAFVTTVKEANELEFSAFERADMLVTNWRGPMWKRHAIGGLEGFPEQQKEFWGKPGRVDWANMPLLADVIAGKQRGRTHDDQIIILLIRGDGVQFGAVAYRVYQLAQKLGLGTTVNTELWLQDPKYIP
jgi:alanine dehydrogenase